MTHDHANSSVWDVPNNFEGATANTLGGSFEMILALGTLFLIILVGVLLYSKAQNVERLKRLLSFLAEFARLAFMGTLPAAALLLAYMPIALFARADPATQGEVLKVGFLVLLAISGLALLGYFTEKWWTRVKQHWEATRPNEEEVGS